MLKFQNDKLHMDANAAPLIPLIPKPERGLPSGINMKFKPTFITAPSSNINPYIF